jgi:hypothetical protein
MRWIFDGIKNAPHPEEAAQRPSRRTHDVDPMLDLSLALDRMK